MSSRTVHHAYLLRLWREESATDGRWRISLHNIHNGEGNGFLNVEELCAYLRYRMAGSASEGQSTESKFE